MLPRVLEVEVMVTPEEAAGYDAMDHSQLHRALGAAFRAAWAAPGPVLDLGTGTAQIPVELCRQPPTARVVAADLAEHMLALARRNVERAGFVDRIEVRK